jgi:MFS family permease
LLTDQHRALAGEPVILFRARKEAIRIEPQVTRRRSLPRTVIALGAVSFFTDLSSEMIYPLLPVFLVGVLGATAVSLGLVEGVAEATAALIKLLSGVWSDRLRRRKPLVLAGYGLSGLARPLVGLAWAWPVVLVLRFTDRLGKGLRTSPRDALIADVTDPVIRGQAYGLHRAMDHGGAVLGPLVAAGLLAATGLELGDVFLLAVVPAVLVMVILALGVREPERSVSLRKPTGAGFRELNQPYRRLLLAVFVFTLGNSTDAFLLLRLTEVGVAPAAVAVLWSAHHVVKMTTTYAGGRACDRWGPKRSVIAGWMVYAAAYLGFGLIHSTGGLIAVFLVYGVYFGLTEPAERAWVAALVPEHLRGAAFGGFHGAVGLAALPASLLFGVLWHTLGVAFAFSCGAALALIAVVLVLAAPVVASKARASGATDKAASTND